MEDRTLTSTLAQRKFFLEKNIDCTVKRIIPESFENFDPETLAYVSP